MYRVTRKCWIPVHPGGETSRGELTKGRNVQLPLCWPFRYYDQSFDNCSGGQQ